MRGCSTQGLLSEVAALTLALAAGRGPPCGGLWAGAPAGPGPTSSCPPPRVQVEFYVNENTFKERLKLFFIKNQRSSEWGLQGGGQGGGSAPHLRPAPRSTLWGPAAPGSRVAPSRPLHPKGLPGPSVWPHPPAAGTFHLHPSRSLAPWDARWGAEVPVGPGPSVCPLLPSPPATGDTSPGSPLYHVREAGQGEASQRPAQQSHPVGAGGAAGAEAQVQRAECGLGPRPVREP